MSSRNLTIRDGFPTIVSDKETIEVVTRADYERLLVENQRLREALEFYAAPLKADTVLQARALAAVEK